MAKKKKVWKSEALDKANRSPTEKIRAMLIEFAKGRSPALKDSERAFDILADQFEKIEKAESVREALELLAWFISTAAHLKIDEESDIADDFESLYADANELFSEKAKDFDDRGFVIDLMHDLAVNAAGEDSRTELFLMAHEFLSREEMRKLEDDAIGSISGQEVENEDEVLTALLDIADGAGDAESYEKIAFLQDQERSNATCINVANAYYVAGDIPNAERLLGEVSDPGNEDEEEFLDLKIGILFKQGKSEEALKLAEELYEKFPKEYHLMSLCQVVKPNRREELLDAHEKFRLAVYVSPDYVNMLATLGEFDRLGRYLDTYKNEIPMMDAEQREELADRLETIGQKKLAERFRFVYRL